MLFGIIRGPVVEFWQAKKIALALQALNRDPSHFRYQCPVCAQTGDFNDLKEDSSGTSK